MFSNKFLAALAALTLASGAVIGTAAPAFANDDVVTDTETTIASVEAPVVEPSIEAPVVVPDAPETSATAPIPEQSVASEPVNVGPPAMSFSTKPAEEPEPEPVVEVEKKVEFCHATASASNPYVMVDTSVNAFYNAGHDTHQNFEDIVPPFSYVKQGQTINFPGLNWNAAGQAIFNNGCERVVVVPGVATASVSFIAASCTAAQQLVLGTATNAAWGTVTDPAGSDNYSVTATATGNAFFPGGLSTLTFHGVLNPVDTSEACDNTTAKKVEFCHATGSDSNPFVLIETSVNAFFNAGHDTHQNFADIVPPFSYVKQGQTIDFPGLNWDATGQAFLAAGCEEPVVIPDVATASVSTTPASCTAAEQLVLGAVTNAVWGPVTDPRGRDDYSVTATATGNALFAGGLTKLTFRGELDHIDKSEACDNTKIVKVEFCHATRSDSNPFVLLNTSVKTFFRDGHDTHRNSADIVPPFSYIKRGAVVEFPGLNWDAEGRAFLEAGCKDTVVVIPDVATAAVSFSPETCTAGEQLVLGAVANATWGPVTDPAGDDNYSVTATATGDAQFAGGLTEITFHGVLKPIDTSEACDNTNFTMVQFCHAAGVETDSDELVFVAFGPAGVYQLLNISVSAFFAGSHDTHDGSADIVPPFSYLTQGEVMEFAGLNWDAAGQAFFANNCEQEIPTLALVLPTVTFTQATCTAAGSYTLGVAAGFTPNQVTFTVNGTPGVLAGTYAAANGSITVTVQPVAPDGIDVDWVNPSAFVFAAPSASDCSPVTTPPVPVTPAGNGSGAGLPNTGSGDGIAGLISLGGGLVFLGAAALYLRRRMGTIG
ncbi:LPXTG cell wall anchor domain-containing protein [Salinibacterium sp. G-O1]|uniref:LPXTG cell wall anchor domain-containing protein n=1 Tax=Salinibacterium sp. G-O1 TaxID=3046208 RepID=UPI0024B903B0|nr:LPXTG cell wall anchor domain-containing protein [Salinibacterium sp. G-O1]MDJ0336446.1 LPXTG cell wall anchor domain-containing protein [Salinibacterium sp. G-O1]